MRGLESGSSSSRKNIAPAIIPHVSHSGVQRGISVLISVAKNLHVCELRKLFYGEMCYIASLHEIVRGYGQDEWNLRLTLSSNKY